ncbi:MAG: hypothetical protein ACFFB4_11660 [Promethearchaeota archaeon]
MKKINRTKLVPKLMILAILMITMITGFAGIFVTANENNQSSTRLTFEGEEHQTIWAPYEMWGDGKYLHMRVYKAADTFGTIDGIEFTGHNELDLHVKMDLATFEYITIGKVKMYIEWNGLVGTFYGPVIAKGTGGVGPLNGKFILQGAGDFEGMKLFGIVWDIDPYWGINGLSGTILIPN